MKVTATEGEKRELDYPKLMISKTSGDIVLFTEKLKGTVVKGGQSSLGNHCNNWFEENFEDYTGKITLENS